MFSSINTCWVLVAAFLVYFMQAGFALCEAGFTRAKNTGLDGRQERTCCRVCLEDTNRQISMS